MELIDTHCHLTESPLVDRLDDVLGRARARGVSRIIAPAYDHASWPQVRAVANRPGVFPAIGLHPWQAAEGIAADELVRELRDSQAVAVGEIGLDFKIEAFDRHLQLSVLRTQLEVAMALELPVILHCRGAFEELLELLTELAPRLTGLIHAFSRGPELARRFAELGLHVAFGGAVTRPDARARKAALALPLDRILLETDAPSIGLDGVPAESAEPHHVAAVAAAVASIRGVEVEAVAAATTANAVRLFSLP
jgi:TatD DNase family protein